MFKAVLDSIIDMLKSAGLNAFERFPPECLNAERSAVAVSLSSASLTSSGCGNYIGICGAQGDYRELYGSRARLELKLEIYEPASGESGAGACIAALDKITTALSDGCTGIKIRSISCEDTQLDRESGMFMCRCFIECAAYLTREVTDEGGSFSDFSLRGDMKNAC